MVGIRILTRERERPGFNSAWIPCCVFVELDKIIYPLDVLVNRHFSLLNVNAAGACGYGFLCDGGRLVRAYVRLRRGAI